MSTAGDARTRTWPPQRWVLWGFIVGVAITVPATFFALLSQTGEALRRYLVPGPELVGPMSDMMATWPGLLNVAIFAVANGAIYATGAGALGALQAVLGRR